MKAATPARWMQQAGQALDSCRTLLTHGDRIGGCNRAYYAAFYAAHAALQAAGAIEPGRVIKTHAGLVSLFGKELVTRGLLPRELSAALGQMLQLRLLSDYDGEDASAAEAAAMADKAEAFVAAIRAAFPAIDAAP